MGEKDDYDNEKTFRQYTPKIPNKKCPAMIFRVSK